ncbi:MAG: hypothetical protein A3I11_01975 [Elusimicrobia bacterium RIFCSPLOWO2_02_FULL_39_32]|nr:MAG: hypothetical protein A3B80_06860 [Elusimicrobia bacterium RIFCSPHIGHO2_02_FULL_39_36]OGR92146.1 MAG: hypothetical protein A3I11_01975 [Elusimicrobia bacterium RIFCSPLOWO2_02_FULL_39_32]OGR99986.1 MAG: hypothetical protein A3G85_03460 [Elusimicrobia bacterium RIFCSPLOWO2_12_FULL_39_28]
MTDPTTIEVSVVIPCLNEAETIGACIQKAQQSFQKNNIEGEIIISDNGSTDDSIKIATALGARVILEKHKGYGSALRKGIESARGKYVVMGDADDSYDFSELQNFIFELRKGWDFVMGTRLRGTILPRAMPLHHRYFGVPGLTLILDILFWVWISDAHCGLRAFTKKGYDKMKIQSTGMEFASEIIIQAKLQKLRISEIPIIFYPAGRKRHPHLRSFRDGLRHLKLIFSLFINQFFNVKKEIL